VTRLVYLAAYEFLKGTIHQTLDKQRGPDGLPILIVFQVPAGHDPRALIDAGLSPRLLGQELKKLHLSK
jgi:hypothetical protein